VGDETITTIAHIAVIALIGLWSVTRLRS